MTNAAFATCPDCGKPMTIPSSGNTQRCTNCGTEVYLAPFAMQQQKRATTTASGPLPGPLLTGYVGLDTLLGLMGEIVGLVFLIYAFVLFFRAIGGYPSPFLLTFLTILGAVATTFFLFKHADIMRARYPNFARGWQMGRDTWGKVVEHLITLVVGVGVLFIFFPLLGVLVELVRNSGGAGWIVIILVAYGFGVLARRMTKPKKGNTIA